MTPTRRSVRRLLPAMLWSVVLVLALAASTRAASLQGSIVVLPTTGVVDNVMAGYVASGIDKAAAEGARAAIVQLDTPGGSSAAMQDIYKALLDPPLPVIVWVGPPGAKAASAGTFITLAANLAYMAPGTNIGAASPIDSSGQDITGTLGEKVKNDAIAAITAISEQRGRPVAWAVSTVSDAKSYSASDAAAAGAVDGIARDLEQVRSLADGAVVDVGGRQVTLDLAGATFETVAMNPFQDFLHLLSDPNIAFILFTLGFYGLLFELQSPNFVTGILGALAIILAFIGFGSLPLNIAGLLLIGLGLVLIALEPTVVSHGLLTIGGIVCIALGASALYGEPGTPAAPDVSVAIPVIVVVAATLAGLMSLVTVAAIRTRRLPMPAGLVGSSLPIGTVGEVRRPLAPEGSVYVAGEEWSARCLDERALPRGTIVRVVRFDGLTAVVEPESTALAS